MSAKKPTIPEVWPRLREYLRQPGNYIGGSLHVVLDDGNVDDRSVLFCIDYAEMRGDAEGAALARLLLRMSKTQRLKLSSRMYEAHSSSTNSN